jgi:hypothetical protein
VRRRLRTAMMTLKMRRNLVVLIVPMEQITEDKFPLTFECEFTSKYPFLNTPTKKGSCREENNDVFFLLTNYVRSTT